MTEDVLSLEEDSQSDQDSDGWSRKPEVDSDADDVGIMLKKAISYTGEDLDFEALARGEDAVNVVHTISNATVRKHLHLWKGSIEAEVLDGLEGKKAIRRFYGKDRENIWVEIGGRDYVIIPGKGVFTLKPPSVFKSRGVACGNFASITGTELYASGTEFCCGWRCRKIGS